jgi:hypothetical protein
MMMIKKIVFRAIPLIFLLFASRAFAEPRIAAQVQTYEGPSIKNGDGAVEILSLKDSAKNAGADAFNKAVRSTVVKFYDDFLAMKKEYPEGEDWAVIRSYPFTGKKYLQVVTHYVVYPNYGNDGNIASFVYDRQKKSLVTVSDVMKQYGLDADELTRRVKKWFEKPLPEGYKEGNESVTGVEAAGVYFVESGDTDTVTPELLLYVTVDVPEAGEWTYLFTYEPDGDETEWPGLPQHPLNKMNVNYLFSPGAVDKMNPPLLVNQADY